MLELLQSWLFWVVLIIAFLIGVWLGSRPNNDEVDMTGSCRTGKVHRMPSVRDNTLTLEQAEWSVSRSMSLEERSRTDGRRSASDRRSASYASYSYGVDGRSYEGSTSNQRSVSHVSDRRSASYSYGVDGRSYGRSVSGRGSTSDRRSMSYANDRESVNRPQRIPVEILRHDASIDDIPVDSVVTPPIAHTIKRNRGPPAVEWGKGKKPSKGEARCKEIVHKIWPNHKFITVRPPWLRNPKPRGRNLELDMYNEELGIAIERHGEQHYMYVPHFHRGGYEDFIAQVERDNIKLDLCNKVGVWLITVPYDIPDNMIERYIRYMMPENVERRNRLVK